MTPDADRLDRANQLFSDALELPADERQPFVQRECGGDINLGESVLRLLLRFENLGGFLQTPAGGHSGVCPGDLLDGRFRIVEILGRGGMGDVYRAEDLSLGEPVALKMVREEWRSDHAMLARFRDEVRLARRISHPNVCKVFGFHTCSFNGRDLAFFEMEYLDGDSLAKALSTNTRFDAAAVLRIAGGIAAGLDAAHREGVIHRDLKPGNVFLGRDRQGHQRPVITDFGLARSVEGGDGSHTQSGVLAGSPDYMAPEQYLGEPPTTAVDIFAFGLIVYEMAAGQRPYPAESILRSAVRRIMEAPPALSRTAPDCPRHWDRVLARALARDPGRRYACATALVRELEESPSAVTAALAAVRVPKISRRSWLVASAVTAVAAIPLIYKFHGATPHVAPGAAVLVAPVENATGDPQLDGVGDLLRGQLQQSTLFNVVSEARVRFMLDRMLRTGHRELDAPTAREVAWRSGIPLVVFGSLTRIGGELALELRLEVVGSRPDRPRAKINHSISVARRDEVFTAVAEGSRWIRSQAGESASSIQEMERRPEDVTTASWKALALMREAQRRRAADKEDEAILLLKEAVQEDPDFALAYMRLADTSFSLYRYEEGLGYWKNALACMRKGRLTMREQLRIEGLYAEDMGDWTAAERAYGTYVAHYPNDPIPWFYRGSVLLRQAHTEAARDSLLRSERLDPDADYTAYALSQCALLSGRFDETTHYIGRLRSLGRASSADAVEGSAAFLRGSYNQALNIFGRLKSSTDPYWRAESYSLIACVFAELGRYREAIAVLNEGLGDAFPSGRLTGRAERLIGLASLHLRSGHSQDCQTAAGQALGTDHGLAQDLMAGVLLARSGAAGEAEIVLRRLAKL